MSTVKEAIDMMNTQHCHPSGFHLTMVRQDLIPESAAGEKEGNTCHRLMKQTYDWRYHEPDKTEYTVKLTADDMKYIGRALEMYNQVVFELHLKPHLESMMKAMSENTRDTYVINFIDGHDNVFKVFETYADSMDEAKDALFEKYGNNFEHVIWSIIKVNPDKTQETVYEKEG